MGLPGFRICFFAIKMDKKEFESVKKLYHYTTLKCACQILESGVLKMSKPRKMNDINEAYREIYSEKGEEFSSLMKGCRQLSLVKDGETPGFRSLPLWGLYANKGRGVCLVFDKSKLVDKLSRKVFWRGEIDYQANCVADIVACEDENIEKCLKKAFFIKDKQWQFEREYRVVSRNPDESQITIGDSLICAIICHTTAGNEEKKKKKLLSINGKAPEVLIYGRFIDEDNLRDQEGNAIWTSKPVDADEIDI